MADGGLDDAEAIHDAAIEALRARRFELADDLLAKNNTNIAELVHGLRVHQIELRMQADELAESNLRLERSLDRFRQLFESLPQAAFVTDRFGRILSGNGLADEVYAVTPGRFESPFLPRLADALDGARIRNALDDADRRGRGSAEGVRLTTPIGSTLVVDIVAARIDAGAPDTDDRFVVLLADVTERMRQAERLMMLDTAVAHLNDVVVITEASPLADPGPRIVFVNDAFERLTEYTSAEAVGQSPRFLQSAATDRAELDRVRGALADRRAVRSELLNVTRSGREYWIEMDIVPVLDAHGDATHFIAVERDVTDRRERESHRRESERLEALGRLTGGVAHDFNNLLAVIIGYLELLDAADDTLQIEAITAIRTATERASTLTSRLLSFARRQALQPVPAELSGAVRSAFDGYLRALLAERAPSVELDLAVDPVRVELDVPQFENALANLLANARDALGDGGTIRVSTGIELVDELTARELTIAAGTYGAVTVTDDGHGISDEMLPHVFEPFVTDKAPSRGTGLGLPMVLGFTQQSGGTTTLRTSRGVGTTVRMLFPLAPSDSGDERCDERDADPVETPRPRMEDCRVLLVEDDTMLRSVARIQLERLGCTVLEATDGPTAVSILASSVEIDLLFTDVNLPGDLSGPDIVEAAVAQGRQLAVVLTSGFPAEALTIDGRLGADVELLAKPYRRDELHAAFERAIARR